MRNTILRLIYGAAVFVAAVFIFELIFSKSGEGMTGEVGSCSFPYIVLSVEGRETGVLYGSAMEADPRRIRPLLQPLPAERRLEATLVAEDVQVSGARYELRSIDGARLLEDGEFDLFPEGDGRYSITLAFNSLMNEEQEYLLTMAVEAGSRTINYYVRVMETDLAAVSAMLSFVRDFHSGAVDRKGQESVVPYIETSRDGPNGDYGLVNIHSSYDTITYGKLDPVELAGPVIAIRDLQGADSLISLTYLMSINSGGSTVYLECEEQFRLKKGRDRVYLLDYKRTMDQVFDPQTAGAVLEDRLVLGILSKAPEPVYSEGGGAFAFVQAGRLYAVTPDSSQITAVYAADAPGDTDLRSFHRDYRIDVLNVDEGGNVFFAVSGYMNRGEHEGETGIYVASYNAAYRTVEEMVFIPYPGSAELLMSETEQLIYHSRGDYLYTFLDGRLLRIRLSDRSVDTLASGLTIGEVCFSESCRMGAYLDSAAGTDEGGAKLVLYDFGKDLAQEITAGRGESLKPLEFIGEDLMYGVGRNADQADAEGAMGRFLMYSVHIVDYALNRQTQYEVPGLFVVAAEQEGNRITLKRVEQLEDGRFTAAEDDQILLADTAGTLPASVSAENDAFFRQIYSVKARGVSPDSVRMIEPRLQIVEEDRVRSAESGDAPAAGDGAYVYTAAGVTGIYAGTAEAVEAAEQEIGTVVDLNAHTVWSRTSRSERNQIMAIRKSAAPAGTDALAACLETMLDFLSGAEETGTAQYDALRAETAEDAVRILEEALPECEVIRLTWSSLDSVLYYVDREIPVIAFSGSGDSRGACLITGFNDQIIVVVDPSTGELRRVSRTKAADELSLTGSYLTCIPVR